ncbi:Pimeloyl-ACP methyl ester carboxylesterase [Halobiforma haloterrestris]|uniref:Pimeloyl-ACP methyl ester carboxylesterase n=1 Tax=Natronobacterium haloterrestre TaxID=148448 RepID=A0A1I1HMG8_NATHA|nr:alpha/beta hydrolase [Halobiforma haloterrestris]SFC24762.1 Pimeloyl-ACP methyl ester carboxylesterase [Halobiforma haloterrestris]
MQTVTSADGTRIGYETFGEGPPLVCLHGSSETRHGWYPLRPALENDFTLVVPDRRGRGGSGDAESYGLEREVEDLRAVVDDLDGDVSVFGHSFGGLVALAAAGDVPVERLVLYEPSLLVGDHRGDDLSDRLQERFAADGREAAMKHFYREGAGIPAPEELPIWPDEVNFDLLETVIRETAAVEAYDLPAEIELEQPTLLLTGERGPAHLREAARTLDDRLPRSRLAELEGVGHVGVKTAPGQVAAELRTFRKEHASRA